MKELTEKQQEYLDFIVDFHKENHVTPTVSEIADHFSCANNNAFEFVEALLNKGVIGRYESPGGKRTNRSLFIITEAI